MIDSYLIKKTEIKFPNVSRETLKELDDYRMDIISKNKVNIVDVKTDVTEGGLANIWIICKIGDLSQLRMIMKAILKLRKVDSVERVHS